MSKQDDDNSGVITGPAEFWIAEDFSRVYLIFQPDVPTKSRREMVQTFAEIAIALACEELGVTRAQLLGIRGTSENLAQA